MIFFLFYKKLSRYLFDILYNILISIYVIKDQIKFHNNT